MSSKLPQSRSRSSDGTPSKKKAKLEDYPSKQDLIALRADYQLLLLRQKLRYERLVRKVHPFKVALDELEKEEDDDVAELIEKAREDLAKAEKQTQQELEPILKEVEEMIFQEVHNNAEYKEAILTFFCWNENDVLAKITQYLDPASLFLWGCAICGVCVPATMESKTVLEELAKLLLERTVLPSKGCQVVNVHQLFQDPDQRVDQDGDVLAKFEHCSGEDIWTNDYYDSLDSIQRQTLQVQWTRKARVFYMDWVHMWRQPLRSRSGTRWLHAAYSYRGCGNDDESDLEDDCQDKDTNELGAYIGNPGGVCNLRDMLDLIFHLAEGHAVHRWRTFILLHDILWAADQANIKCSLRTEKRHALQLLDGRAVIATLWELAHFDSGFHCWEYPMRRTAKLKWRWEEYFAQDVLVEKAKETIFSHIETRDSEECFGEWASFLEDDLQQPPNCDTGSDIEEWLEGDVEIPCMETCEAEARSLQAVAQKDLEAFARDVLPSLPPVTMPDLIGDSWKTFKACNCLVKEGIEHVGDKRPVSPSATIFVQQVVEDLGLGIAPRPFLVQLPGVGKEVNCHVIFGRRGFTMVRKLLGDENVEDGGAENENESETSDSDYDPLQSDEDTEAGESGDVDETKEDGD